MMGAVAVTVVALCVIVYLEDFEVMKLEKVQ